MGDELSQTRRRRRPAKKPLKEIESGTQTVTAKATAAKQELLSMIMSIGSLSKEEREALLIAANKALAETMCDTGFHLRFLNEKQARAGAEIARVGNAEKAAKWNDEAKRLVADLWKNRPNFKGNLDSTAKEIDGDLQQACKDLGFKAPAPETVARFLAESLRGNAS
jgi:hypothetical protein